MTAAGRTRFHALFLWLALALAGAHALLPVGSPLARTNGSAFSAFTADVALGPNRRESRNGETVAAEDGERAGIFIPDLSATLPGTAQLHDPRLSPAATPAAVSLPAPAAHLPVGYLSRAPPRA